MLVGHIFISYRSTEADFTLRLAADLKNQGVRVWVDRLDGGIQAGDEWRHEIEQAVNTCAAMITVVSPDYLSSKYCRREMNRADDLGRPIFPVLLRPIPKEDWPLAIQDIQYTDFTNWQDEKPYWQSFDRLMQAVRQDAAGQIGTVPSAEVQYLTSLIAKLESRKGVLEYVELTAQADAPERPNPHRDTSGWDASFAVIVSQDVGTRHVVSDPTPQKIPLNSIAEAVEKHPRFVLIGEPGAGKTTTLRRLALDAARKRLEDRSAPLPFLFYLPTWGDEPTLADFIQSRIGDVGANRRFAPTDNIFLYLDGLNEMGAAGTDKAKKLREWIHSSDASQHVIITCRAGDYAGDLDLDLPTVLAEEMQEPQIRQFAMNYLGDEAAPKFLARVLPEKDKDREDVRHLFRLARNPYLLAALIFVHTSSPDGDLPRNMGALMRMLARALWERERQRGTLGWIPFEEMEVAFARLAFAMIDEDMPIDVPQEWTRWQLAGKHWWQRIDKEISTLLEAGRSANLVELHRDRVRFYHQLMQEYFASYELARIGVVKKLIAPEVRFRDVKARKWENVIISLCGITSDADIVVSEVTIYDPFLAAECIASGISISEKVGHDVTTQLLEYSYDENSLTRHSAIYALGLTGDPRAVSRLLQALGGPNWLMRYHAAHALEALGDMRAIPGLLRALHDKEPIVCLAAARALAVMGDAAVPKLVECLTDMERPGPLGIAMSGLGTVIVKRPMDIDQHYRRYKRVCDYAAEALERIGTPEALEAVARWRAGQQGSTE